jgi:DNA-binding transcriptional LysR family regulator
MHEIDIGRLDLNLLKAFAAIMQERSMTAAGARLGLAQSSVSHALARLRAGLGNPLFVKTTSGMQPTPYALRIAPRVDEALASLQSALSDEAAFSPSRSERVFNLLMTDVVELMFLPKLLHHLQGMAPQIGIAVHQLPRSRYRDALEHGEADLALGQLPPRHSDFLQQHLFDTGFVCVMRAKHPLRNAMTLSAFLHAQHLVIGSPAIAESLVKRALGSRASRRRIALQLPHYMVAPFVLAQTDLIAVLPEPLSAAFLRLGLLAVVPVPFPVSPVVIRQFWHPRSDLDPGNQWLRRVIADLFADRRQKYSARRR